VAGDGSGTTIAIVDAYDDPNIANDLHQFDLRFGLPDPVFTKVNQNGGSTMPSPNGGWISEIALDVEWSHAIAPKANILLVEANSSSNADLFQAVRTAARTPGVVAVSMSWAGGESSGETGTDASTFVTPAGHAGVTFFASSGDTGAPAVYPSASPNVVSVGGTTLNLNSSSNITSESAWSGSGGGISSVEAQPSYQNGVVTQTSSRRATPDVSYDANPATGFPVYDSYNNPASAAWVQFGGTSDAAPQWAALIAIADQGRALNGLPALDGPRQTLPALYQMPAGYFHDITSGGSTGSPPYSAGTGYDLVTGRGTPVANLVVGFLAIFGSGPRVVAATPVTDGQGGVSAINLTFNVAIQDGTFTLAGVDGLNGPAGSITPAAVTKLSNTQYQVSFADQTAPGNYTLTIGPNIKDLFGDPMDQNGNGHPGENPGDLFTTTFGLPLPATLPFQENFDDNIAHGFVSQSGSWSVNGGRYSAAPSFVGGDEVSLLQVSGALPDSLELDVTMNAAAATGSNFSNGFAIFDYQSPTNFKFAGAFIGLQEWVVGHRDANGWEIDALLNDPTITAGTDYGLTVLLQGDQATLLVNGMSKVTYAYTTAFSGSVGVGTQNSVSQFDNLAAQQYVPPSAPDGTLPIQENFDDGTAQYFAPQLGNWSVSSGRYGAAPSAVGGDAVSLLQVSGALPSSLEFDVTMNATAGAGSFFSNGFVIFDYQSPTNFKIAGAFVGMQEWVVGHRDANGWEIDASASDPSIKAGTDYNLQLLLQGGNANLLVNGAGKVGFSYASAFSGSIGLGAQNSLTGFDNLLVQQPSSGTLPIQENFDDGVAHYFSQQAGAWAVSAGRYGAAPTTVGGDAVSLLQINGALPSNLEMDVTMNATAGAGTFFSNGFLIFDYQSPTNFKFAGAYIGLQEWVVGHRDANGWQVDTLLGDPTIMAGTDYNLQLLLQGNSASLLVNGVSKVSHTYAAAFSGSVGLGTSNSLTQFDNLTVK
jgi:hypothetical protein